MVRRKNISKDLELCIIEFYKQNSTNITCEEFQISFQTLFTLLAENNIQKHTANENRELTSLARFGVRNAGLSLEKQQKAKQTTFERYGDCNFRNNQLAQETRVKHCGSVEESYKQGLQKQRQTNKERFGADYYLSAPTFKDKAKETNFKKYGVENFRQSDQYIEKYKQTCQTKYGVDHYSKTENYVRKVKQTCNDRYGADSWFASAVGKNKIQEASLSKYGTKNPMNSEFVRNTPRKSILKKYGVDNVMHNPSIRSKQAKSSHNSSFEIAVAEWLKINNKTFERHYVIKNTDLIHEFDFAVVENSELKLLIDCDGLYYHAYLDDINGKSVNPIADEYRMLLIPKDVDFIVVCENDYEEKLTTYFDSLDYKQQVFDWCRSIGFPYPVIKDIQKSYNSLVKADYNKFSINSRIGQRVIDQFHKSIWLAHRKGYKSPYDAWFDDNLLRRCIDNRLIYIGNELDPSKVLYGFNASKIAPKVSVFNPYLAKYLINKYLNEFKTIFDPCSGYSGRLLGACSTNKHYIGQDINQITVTESIEIIQQLQLNATVSCLDSTIVTGIYDCLFTCPPYNDKELWNYDLYNYSCDQWIDIFLNNYNCRKYLFVVDDTDKYKHCIVEEIENKSHLNSNKEYVILIES